MTHGFLVRITSNTEHHIGSGIPCSPRLTPGNGMEEDTGDSKLEHSTYAQVLEKGI